MKHVANRKKAVSPLPRKSFTQPKTAVKKASSVSAAKSGKQTLTKTAKIAAKSAPVVQERKIKPKASPSKKKIAVTNLKTAILDKKKNVVAVKPAPPVNKPIVKQKSEKSIIKSVAEIVKAKTQKLKTIAAVQKNETVKSGTAKAKLKVGARTEKPKSLKVATTNSAAKSVKQTLPKQAETKKKQSVKSRIQIVKVARSEPKKLSVTDKIAKKVSQPKAKVATKKVVAAASKITLPTAKSKKTVQPTAKVKPTPSLKESVAKTRKSKPLILPSTSNRTPKKASPPIGGKLQQLKANKANTVVEPVKVIKAKTRKVKAEKTPIVAPVNTSPSKKVQLIAPPIEVVNVPLPKPKKKKIKPLGGAIFRGKKERYDFQVFPIEGEFEDTAAIFIISRRILDKNKRAHHRMVCIGQTDSILSELKKHRKGKCFKKYEANAISVLREENEQKRLKIEADLKSAHTIPCPHA